MKATKANKTKANKKTLQCHKDVHIFIGIQNWLFVDPHSDIDQDLYLQITDQVYDHVFAPYDRVMRAIYES